MTSKEYLSQAFYLDQRISSKATQIESLNALAEKCTSVWSDMPRNPNQAINSMANTIASIVDLQTEITNEADKLIALKKELVEVIRKVNNCEYRLLLEKRYLCFMNWEAIAVEMHYTHRWILQLHGKALNEVDRNRDLD